MWQDGARRAGAAAGIASPLASTERLRHEDRGALLRRLPHHEALLPSLRYLASERGVDLELRRIQSLEQAEQARFLGSPSVRVNGVDVEPDAQQRTDFGLKCRLYRSPDGQSGLPPQQWIERALRAALQAS